MWGGQIGNWSSQAIGEGSAWELQEARHGNLPSAGLVREACPGGDVSSTPGEWEAGGLEPGVALERGSEGCVLDS